MTRKVTGRILDAPPTWLAASVAPKVEAVAAATMPRGAIQPVNARSPLVSSVRMVARKATSGRVTSTRTATRARVGSTRCCSDAGVTVAEMDTNRTPMISCTRVSKNGRLAGTSKARRFATASPIKIAAMSPASSRTMSQAAATPTTHASWARGGEQIVQVKLAQAHPQHRHADYRAGHADAGGQQELAQRVADPAAGARQHGVEHHRAQDAADRVDQRALPGQYPLQAIGRPDESQQRGHHRRPGHHQDRAGHQRRPGRHAQQRAGQHRGERHRDRHPPDHQAGYHAAGAPVHLAPLQRQAGVIEDHRHRERDQRLERRPQQALRVDVGGQRARGEARREQDDQRRDAQPARQHLRAHREHHDQAHPDQDLVGGHCLLSSPRGSAVTSYSEIASAFGSARSAPVIAAPTAPPPASLPQRSGRPARRSAG